MLTYITNYIKDAPVYFAMSFEAGGMYQSRDSVGVAHLAEHLVAASELSEGLLPAQTDHRFITLFISKPCLNSDDLSAELHRLCKTVISYVATPESIRKESSAIANELANFSIDYPNTNKVILHDYLFTGLQPRARYEIVSGNIDGNNGFGVDDVNAFIHSRLNKPAQVIVSGDFNLSSIKTILDSYFPKTLLNSEKTDDALMPLRSLDGSGRVIKDPTISASTGQSYVGMGWSLSGPSAKQIAIALLAVKLLSDTNGSLYVRLRQGRRSVYSLSSDATYARERLNVSLHASSSDGEDTLRDMGVALKDFTASDALRRETEKALGLEREIFPILKDGSRETFSNQLRLSRLGLTIEEYQAQVDDMGVDEVLDFISSSLSFDGAVKVVG